MATTRIARSKSSGASRTEVLAPLVDAWTSIHDHGNDLDCCVFSYDESNTITVSSTGSGGLAEIISQLEESSIQFAGFQFQGHKRPMYAFLTWIGPKVPAVKRGRAANVRSSPPRHRTKLHRPAPARPLRARATHEPIDWSDACPSAPYPMHSPIHRGRSAGRAADHGRAGESGTSRVQPEGDEPVGPGSGLSGRGDQVRDKGRRGRARQRLQGRELHAQRHERLAGADAVVHDRPHDLRLAGGLQGPGQVRR
jgi:hypothetical protein